MDITLARGRAGAVGRLPSLAAHEQAVAVLLDALQTHRNWYLDLANERDVRDERFVGTEELARLRQQVRQLDPQRLVTASFGGHDLTPADVHDSLLTIGLDFLAPHRPRDPDSPGQTEQQTRAVLAMQRSIGRSAPVHYQEPFRRGYGDWEPVAEDFLMDLRGAVAGGAAGWCFHNGQQRSVRGNPPRSFDLRRERLCDQLDAEEQRVVAQAAAVVAGSHE